MIQKKQEIKQLVDNILYFYYNIYGPNGTKLATFNDR